jgi:hypothetical protein
MANKINFYTTKDIDQLKSVKSLSKQERLVALRKFAKENKRSFDGVYYKYLTSTRSIDKNGRKIKNDASLKTSPNSKKGEFIIPVKNWKLQHENGNLNLVINF